MAVDLKIKQNAYKILNAARREKLVIASPVCELCGRKTHTIAHHPDYNKPLEVMWICERCHRRTHLGREITPYVPKDIKTLRKEIYGTQAKLARKLYTSASAISLIERGIRVPHYSTRRTLARILKVTVEELGFDGSK